MAAREALGTPVGWLFAPNFEAVARADDARLPP